MLSQIKQLKNSGCAWWVPCNTKSIKSHIYIDFPSQTGYTLNRSFRTLPSHNKNYNNSQSVSYFRRVWGDSNTCINLTLTSKRAYPKRSRKYF